jgi:predicted transcriptional regulator
MGEKIAKTGIKRDNDLMYYIKNGDVWATPRKKPGQPKGKAQKVASAGIEMDYSKYLYYLDGEGDVARKERQVGGSKRKSSKASKPAAKKAAPKKAAEPAAEPTGE